MARNRVDRLLDTYFNRPVEDYLRVVTSLRKTGGLSSEEVRQIESRIPYVHADTIIRHSESGESCKCSTA